MATVTLDLEHTGNRTWLDENGWHVDRVALVEGITPGSNDSVVYDAINDAGIPSIGDAHPTIASIKLKSIVGAAVSQTKAELTLSYEQDDNDTTTASESQARISASTAIEEQQTDANGAAMTTTYTVTNTLFSWSIFDEQFTAEVEKPRLTFEFGYKTGTHPIDDINTYLGKTNSAVWNGYAINSILCSNIEVNQEGSQYSVRYTFIYNPDTWTFFAKISEPAGNIASSTDTELDTATGIKEFEVYSQVDFNPLGFNFQNIIALSAGGAALSSQSASMTGAGVMSRDATGALAAQDATMTGTGEISKTGTGALAAQSATMTGSGTVTPP